MRWSVAEYDGPIYASDSEDMFSFEIVPNQRRGKHPHHLTKEERRALADHVVAALNERDFTDKLI